MPWAAKTHQAQQAKRPSRSKRGYGRAWQRIRAAHLASKPLCADCKAKGLTVAATCVDHVDGDSFNNDPGNHRSLCSSCHARKTVVHDGGFGR